MTTQRVPPAPLVEEVLRTTQAAGSGDAVAGGKPPAKQQPRQPRQPRTRSAVEGNPTMVGHALSSLHDRQAAAAEVLAADGPSAGVGELPGGLGDIGEYVQRLMQDAHAAADTYRHEAEAGAQRAAAEIIAAATREAEDVRDLATAEAEAIVASAQGALAERIVQMTVLVDRLISLGESVVDNPAAAGPVNANALRLVGVLVSAADTAAAYLDEHANNVKQTTQATQA